MKDIVVIMRSIGEVTNTKFSLLYIQIIIHGTFSREGKCSAIKGRIISRMPIVKKVTPTSEKGG